MNAHEPLNSGVAKKVCVALSVLLAFMVLSNFLSWTVSTTYAKNLRASFIGSTIQNVLYQRLGEDLSNNFSLARDEVSSRLVVREKTQAYLTLPRSPDSVAMGNIDQLSKAESGWKLRGWTNVPKSAGKPEFVIAVEDEKVIGVLAIDLERPDVAKALNVPQALRTGYSGQINRQHNTEGCRISLYTLTSSLKLFSMPNLCDKANQTAH